MRLRSWQGEAHGLAERIAAFMDGSLASEPTEPFDALALDIHRWQRAHDTVINALCDAEPSSWQEIPAVPVELFKHVPVGTVRPGSADVEFRTSGTTGGGRGVHRMRSSELYDHGALEWARRCVPDAPGNVVAILEDPVFTPDSSLSHMVALFSDFSSPPGPVSWHLVAGRIDHVALRARVQGAAEPLFVASTAFALADWLVHAGCSALPPDSVLMVTGGFKGRVHRFDGSELYALAQDKLAPARIVTEYGMTELSSQLWGTRDTPFRPPPWLRALAVDPSDGRPLASGERGQLRFVDLANLDGTLAIDTLDEGIVHDDGGVTLFGRLRGAPARGCSLTVEEGWEGL